MSNIKYSGKLILLVGPSGVGKSTILGFLKEKYPDFVFIKSATTRARRATEAKDAYHFMTKDEFEFRIKQGDFIEYAHVHGDNYYGVLRESVIPLLERGATVIREVDIQGVVNFTRDLGGDHLKSIFLLPPSQDVLIKRIQERAPISDEEIADRMESLEKEVAQAGICTHQIQFADDGTISENFEKVEKTILDIIKEK